MAAVPLQLCADHMVSGEISDSMHLEHTFLTLDDTFYFAIRLRCMFLAFAAWPCNHTFSNIQASHSGTMLE